MKTYLVDRGLDFNGPRFTLIVAASLHDLLVEVEKTGNFEQVRYCLSKSSFVIEYDVVDVTVDGVTRQELMNLLLPKDSELRSLGEQAHDPDTRWKKLSGRPA